jgi:hypothetical protein
VTMSHFVLRLEVADDRHVLVEATAGDDLLPLGDRTPVFLLNRRKVRRRSLLWPWCILISHDVVLFGYGGCRVDGEVRPHCSASRDIDLPPDTEPIDEGAEDVAPEHLLKVSLDHPSVAQ